MLLALRTLLKSPGYTAVALLTLALGIGINTSMVSVVDALLFRSGPFPEPDRIVQLVGGTQKGTQTVFSATEINEIRPAAAGFAGLTIVGNVRFAYAEPDRPAERISAALVSADFFTTFGLQPLLGRAFTPAEFEPGRNQVVVLSHGFWTQRFGGDPNVLGRTLRLDGDSVTIVGVMPPAFDYRPLWGHTALWRPVNFTRDQVEWRDYRVFQLYGRLRTGVTGAQITAELAPLAAAQAKQHPDAYSELRYHTVVLQDSLMDKVGKRVSWMLLGLSGFVLLIACANLANLQLARATASSRDYAIRGALGASRWQLLLQPLRESLALSILGGVLGLALAFVLNQSISRILEANGTLNASAVRLHPGVLLVTVGVSLTAGVLFGLAPGWFAARTDVNAALKQQSRGTTAGRGHHRFRNALIVFEVSLALVLLGGAAILQRGFSRLMERETGWDVDRVVVGALPVPETRIDSDPKRNELFRRLEARLAALPGVEHAAIATSVPVFSYTGDRAVLIHGETEADVARSPAAFHVMVSPDYFSALGIKRVDGQLFSPDIKAADKRVVIVNEALAKRLWPGGSAVGQRLGSMDSGKAYWAEVIGVVRDVDTAASLADPTTPYHVYKPLVHEPWSYVHVVVRGAPGLPRVDALGDALRRAVTETDPNLVLDQVGSVRRLVDDRQYNLVMASRVLAGFAMLGLALAAIGLYGVIANVVAQRTTEFGIRLALGARPADVLRLVMTSGLQLTLVGAALGAMGTFLLARFLASVMPRVAVPDPIALLTTAALLIAAALLACWLPARRATKVDPLVALRAE